MKTKVRQLLRAIPEATLLAVALLTLGASVGACQRKTAPTLYIPASGTQLDITLTYPFNAVTGSAEMFSSVCAGAQAFLVGLDVDSASQIAIDYRFLLGLDGQLFGCASGACSPARVATQLPAPHRIVVEGIDVAPAAYSSTSAFNVLCRGVADDTLPMGGIVATAVPTPDPATSPVTGVAAVTVSVSVPMLRIGDNNGTFSTAGPRIYGAMAAPLGTPPIVRTPGGGKFAVAGGELPYTTSIHVFDPRSISFAPPSATLSYPRYIARAIGLTDSAGNASVLFAAGMDNDTGPTTVELWDGKSASTRVFGMTASLVRGGLGAVLVPGHHEQGASLPIVALLGGGVDDATQTPTYDFFYPRAPPDVSACVPGVGSGAPGMCRPGAGVAMGDGGHRMGAFGRITTPFGERIFVGAGAAVLPVAGNFSGKGYFFDPENGSFASVSGIGLASYGPPTVVLTTSVLAYFGGGIPTGSGLSNQWTIVRGRDATQLIGPGTMRVARGFSTATRLLDGRVLIAGGDATFQSIEAFVPSVVLMTAGTFSFVAKHPDGVCTAGSESGCVAFATGRAEPTAVRIDGSRSWINGSVIFSSGEAGPEIFVPAYACGGTQPVRFPDGLPVVGVDFCDRLRARQLITNPDAPERLPPE